LILEPFWYVKAVPSDGVVMSAADHAHGRATSILIVEDEEHIRQLTATVLERAGFNVLQASDARQAAEIWSRESSSIHMLLADIVVPGKTGAELAIEFRKTDPMLKVILISGSDRKTLVETAQMVRGAKFLRKPYNANSLLNLVRGELRSIEAVAMHGTE
jgi:DNA-binding NtrC family response regulator